MDVLTVPLFIARGIDTGAERINLADEETQQVGTGFTSAMGVVAAHGTPAALPLSETRGARPAALVAHFADVIAMAPAVIATAGSDLTTVAASEANAPMRAEPEIAVRYLFATTASLR